MATFIKLTDALSGGQVIVNADQIAQLTPVPEEEQIVRQHYASIPRTRAVCINTGVEYVAETVEQIMELIAQARQKRWRRTRQTPLVVYMYPPPDVSTWVPQNPPYGPTWLDPNTTGPVWTVQQTAQPQTSTEQQYP